MCEELLDMIYGEIANLDIDPDVKESILYKVKRAHEEDRKREESLLMCYTEIDQLKNVIVEQAKIIGILQKELDER